MTRQASGTLCPSVPRVSGDDAAPSGGEVSDLLTACRLSERQLASLTGYSQGAVHRWCDGTAQPPAEVLAWLRRCAALMASLPPPPRRQV